MFFYELIKNKISTSKLIDFHMTKVININTNVLSYTLQDLEILYKNIVPFFSSMVFNSSKKLDYEM
jgi:hypothetical protein